MGAGPLLADHRQCMLVQPAHSCHLYPHQLKDTLEFELPAGVNTHLLYQDATTTVKSRHV